MHTLTPLDLSRCFVNTSRRESAAISPPDGLEDLPFADLDILGWRDRKIPERSYVVVPVDDEPRGIMLRTVPRGRAQSMCGWCEDIVATNGVRMFSARLAGAAGRRGDVVGTLLHADFACSAIARRAPSTIEGDLDPTAFTARRVTSLQARSQAFARRVMSGRDR